ncbi:MAG: DoxX family protein [Alphaproteobacteria bacterium]|nr:DoxX family protein [Alphaproteobacteria bacterium]
MSVLEFGMRLAVGATFFKSGMNKFQSFDSAIELFREEYRLPLLPPEIAAYMGTTVELCAPVLLVLGIFARFGAAALLVMTLTIQFLVYPGNWPEHLMWASILAYVLTRGPGALSIDRVVAFNLFGRA